MRRRYESTHPSVRSLPSSFSEKQSRAMVGAGTRSTNSRKAAKSFQVQKRDGLRIVRQGHHPSLGSGKSRLRRTNGLNGMWYSVTAGFPIAHGLRY